MQLTIDKKRIVKAIDELPEDTTIEEAIERLVFLHKIQIGLNQTGGKTHEEMKREFRERSEGQQG